jgi:hypothetical protein
MELSKFKEEFMRHKNQYPFAVFLLVPILVSLACGAQPVPEPTASPTVTVIPSKTPRPSATPRPTMTPNLAATQLMDDYNAEAQGFFDKGFLTTADGKSIIYDDFLEDWAQINYYQWWTLEEKAQDFYVSAHFHWSSALRNSNESGCGFVFAIQDNGDHYAVFLDRTKIIFLKADQSQGYSRDVGTTRGTGRVKFDNPADADFALIVKGTYAYVLVDKEVVGEYTLAQSTPTFGNMGLSVLSGTNKDYGTRCEMTNIHIWTPDK